MLLYHGSLEKVEVPVLDKSKESNDFGKEFYLTSSKRQALKWAKRNMRINDKEKAYISVFNFIDNYDLNIFRFYKADYEWLNFVLQNRRRKMKNNDYDLIIGPVANDQVYNTLLLFESNLIDMDKTLEMLKTQKLFDQYLFRTKKSLQKLVFVKCIEVS